MKKQKKRGEVCPYCIEDEGMAKSIYTNGKDSFTWIDFRGKKPQLMKTIKGELCKTEIGTCPCCGREFTDFQREE